MIDIALLALAVLCIAGTIALHKLTVPEILARHPKCYALGIFYAGVSFLGNIALYAVFVVIQYPPGYISMPAILLFAGFGIATWLGFTALEKLDAAMTRRLHPTGA